MYEDIRSRLETAWCAETAAGDSWDPSRPSKGQCAVTAMVLQDEFGGELMRTTVQGDSHYFNYINGMVIDFTRDQYPVWVEDGDIVLRDRSYVESSPDTMRRYRVLKERFDSV